MKVAKPKRASHTYTQQLAASWRDVFPLLCPVREADWMDGWDPVSVASSSGLAERDCVFVTSAGADRAIWYITRHEPETGCIEMIKVTPEVTACRLEILVGPAAQGAERPGPQWRAGPARRLFRLAEPPDNRRAVVFF